MKLFLVLALGLAAVTGTDYEQFCGGAIINNRSILSAAHCLVDDEFEIIRARVGSSYASSGGIVHMPQSIFNHPEYKDKTLDHDIGILRIVGVFAFNDNVRPGSIAGPNLNVPDNAAVWAIGWGRTSPYGPPSEQLRHVQIWVVNQDVCRERYAELGNVIIDSMLCAGWLDVGGRDQCTGDSGSPLMYNNVVVGVCSWGESCALPRYPSVNARVSSYTNWIQNNA